MQKHFFPPTSFIFPAAQAPNIFIQ
jgi:hypothetical protein